MMTDATEPPPTALLRGVGLRVTQQRLAVLDAFVAAGRVAPAVLRSAAGPC